MIEIEELFRHTVVISMAPHRIELMRKSFQVAGLPLPKYCLVPKRGTDYATKTLSCKHSHGKAVQFAKDNGWPYVFVFEDDAWPRFDCRQQLQRICNALPQNGIKLLLVGACSYATVDSADGIFNEVVLANGAQSYIVFKEAYDAVIKCASTNELSLQFDQCIGKHASEQLGFKSHIVDTVCFIQYNAPSEKLMFKRTRYNVNYIHRNERSPTKNICTAEPPQGFPAYEDIVDSSGSTTEIKYVQASNVIFKTHM